MQFSTILTYIGVILSAFGLYKAVVAVWRQFIVEKELTAKVAADREFRRRYVRFLEEKKKRGHASVESDRDFLKYCSAVFERESRLLDPQKRRLVNPGLHQVSDRGRWNYISKLASQSEKRVSATTVG